MTIGYSTLYGDLGGYMALLGDLWKDQVYDLARYLNQEVYKREVVPQGTIDIVPSAELSASQDVTKGQGDPLHYPYHDKLFYSWVQRWERATPEDNLRWYLEGTLAQELGCPEECISELFPTAKDFVSDLERWWNLYQGMAVAKRVQAPPILSLSSRAFGYDHREFLGTPYYSEEYMRLKAGV
jgi:NAD+ synthase (glutamine-hydrolysing)